MNFLLEYNEEHGWFHYNYLDKGDEWHNFLFSYGWRPVSVIPENIATENKDFGFGDLLNDLTEKGYTYEKVCNAVYKFLLKVNENGYAGRVTGEGNSAD